MVTVFTIMLAGALDVLRPSVRLAPITTQSGGIIPRNSDNDPCRERCLLERAALQLCSIGMVVGGESGNAVQR